MCVRVHEDSCVSGAGACVEVRITTSTGTYRASVKNVSFVHNGYEGSACFVCVCVCLHKGHTINPRLEHMSEVIGSSGCRFVLGNLFAGLDNCVADASSPVEAKASVRVGRGNICLLRESQGCAKNVRSKSPRIN